MNNNWSNEHCFSQITCFTSAQLAEDYRENTDIYIEFLNIRETYLLCAITLWVELPLSSWISDGADLMTS